MFLCGVYIDTLILAIAFLIIIYIYYNVTKGIYRGNERLDGKTAIVTGSCSGIGAETSKDLARRGAKVIMVCKEHDRGENIRQNIIKCTGNSNVVMKLVDLTSLESVRQCAKEILAEEARIDILVNNAGAFALNLHEKTVDGLEVLMQTNHYGPFLFTNILLGKIQDSSPARIVNVASIIHSRADFNIDDINQTHVKNRWMMYANSKLATVYFTIFLADKLKGTGVTVNCLHPGMVDTQMGIDLSAKCFKQWKKISKFLIKSPWEGAQTSIFLCVSPSVENVTGKYFSDCKESEYSKHVLNYSRAQKLWEMSERAVQLKDCERHLPNYC